MVEGVMSLDGVIGINTCIELMVIDSIIMSEIRAGTKDFEPSLLISYIQISYTPGLTNPGIDPLTFCLEIEVE